MASQKKKNTGKYIIQLSYKSTVSLTLRIEYYSNGNKTAMFTGMSVSVNSLPTTTAHGLSFSGSY